MAKKIFLNIFLNIAIFTMLLSVFWSFNHAHYGLAIGAVVVLAMLIFFKIRLVKQVREMTRKKD